MGFWRRWPLVFNGLLSLFLCSAVLAEAASTRGEALKKAFPEAAEFSQEKLPWEEGELEIFSAKSGGQFLGWAVEIEEKGKISPVTFLTAIDTQGNVLGVYVTQYCDHYGAKMKRRSFLRQFQGKLGKDPIAVGRDIDAVTQATISSQAAAEAVRKSLKISEELRAGAKMVE